MSLDGFDDAPGLGVMRWRERAAQIYREALDRNPHNPSLWVQYGHALRESGELRDPDKLAQAEIAYRRALSLDPEVADTYLQLEHVPKLQEKTEEARTAYLRAAALGPSPEGATTPSGWHEAQRQDVLGNNTFEMDNSGTDVGPLTANSGKSMDGSELHAPDSGFSVSELLLNTESALPPDVEPIFLGNYDGYYDGLIGGWALYKNAPATAVEIAVIIDGESIGTTLANKFRQDLFDCGIGTGYHSFEMMVPSRFWDGQPHEVMLSTVGCGHVLTHHPASVVFGGPDRLPPHVFSPGAAILADQTPVISVIMPTYNRGDLMERSIEKYIACSAQLNAELIVIDDGSRDDTPDRLQRLTRLYRNLVTERITNSGPARARNLACSMARGTILLFVGDDIMPADDDLLRIHLTAHRRFPELGQAILGKISWPSAIDFPVNFVMAFVQGDGQQQFGYKYMRAYSKYSWKHFYTANVSVKRAIVQDWEKDGFDTSFSMAAFEDGEFALRMTERFQGMGEDFGILYVPAANTVHFHPFTVESFVRRQVSVGMMAAHFLDLHPERETDLGLSKLIARLKTNPDESNFRIDHYLAIFEGLRSWLSVIEDHQGLGTQNWHGDALAAIFRLAYLEGYLRSQTRPDLNYASACRYLLETVQTDMNRAIFSEVIDRLPSFSLA